MIESGYIVTYNGSAPWGSGIGAGTPYVSVDIEEVWQAGRQGFARTVTLNGTVPSGGVAQITGIRSCFATNFKPFIAPNIGMSGAMVQSVNFAPQNYMGKVDYSIVLKDFSGFISSVSDLVDEVSFQDQADGTVIVNHRVSAIGISTTSDASMAFINAKNFVIARTGLNTINAVTTSFVNATNKSNIYVVSQQENINRFNAAYSISEVFRYDPLRNISNGTCSRFSVELNSGINEDYTQVSVNGVYQVGKDVYDSDLIGRVSKAELYALATSMYGAALNSTPASFNVEIDSASENMYTRTVTVRALFDNSQSSSFFDYDIETNKDFKNGVTQASIKGQIMGSGRHVRAKYDSALNFFNNTLGGIGGAKGYMYRAAVSGAAQFGYTSYSFNPQAKNFSVTFNSGQGIITINSSYDDAPFVSGYNDFSWGVNVDCGVNVFKPHPSANVNGSYLIQDLDILNRSSVTINGNFVYPATGAFSSVAHASIRTKLINLEGAVNAFLEAEGYNISSGESIKTGFHSTYTKEGCGLTDMPSGGKIYAGVRI